jgi:cysteine desulfurase
MIKANSTAHVHVDAVQSFGKIPLELCPSIDSLSVTSHKLGGPKAIAGLFLKNGHKISPLLLGGGQENGFRSGTVAFPLIQAFHKAMEISHQNLLESLKKITSLNEEIRKRLTHIIPTIQFPFLATSPYVLSLVLPNISSDIILRHLEEHEIYLSSTSACSSKIVGHNPALLALGLPEKLHKSFLRISMGPLTSSHEVDALIEEFQRTWENLKHLQGNK